MHVKYAGYGAVLKKIISLITISIQDEEQITKWFATVEKASVLNLLRGEIGM